uniref:Retrovirus-related Pol polyprotein from transposon TNT 1-94 n=1 Tax=Tanacetum cinerariifolium TaxID=118510 RepID=A0A699GQD7_TANCI|nr:retrovirus-related Pol polyprotein from transposon TNT 1-94 [Tanacetum cinerariifolium]
MSEVGRSVKKKILNRTLENETVKDGGVPFATVASGINNGTQYENLRQFSYTAPTVSEARLASVSFATLQKRDSSRKGLNFHTSIHRMETGLMWLFRWSLFKCYARALIQILVDVELKETIVVAMPKLIGEGFHTCTVRVEYEWKPPSVRVASKEDTAYQRLDFTRKRVHSRPNTAYPADYIRRIQLVKHSKILTYEEHKYELDNNMTGDLEETWSDNRVPYQLCDHICEPYHFKNGKVKRPTCSADINGFCNDGELPSMIRVGCMTYFQDHKWNYGANKTGDTQDSQEHMKEHHDPSIFRVKRFKMMKYSFDVDDEYVAIKEYDHFDHSRTNINACQAYRELFLIMDEGWLMTKIDCNYHQKQFQNQRMVKPIWNNAHRVNHQNFAKKTHPGTKKNMVSKAVLMKSSLVSINTAGQNISKTAILVNTARQVNAAHSKTTVSAARSMLYLSKIAHSTVKRPIHLNITFKNSNVNQRVNTVRSKKFNTARPKAVVNVVKENNSNVVKASAWNMSYLIDYEEIVGGYVAFGGNPKGGKITTKDHLGKFDGKADEGFFIGYSLNSKTFRVFNSRTRIVEQNLHIRFSKSTPNVIGTQSNGFASTKASDNAGQARKETEPVKDYILLPLWTTDLLFSQDPKSSPDDGSKPSSDDRKKVDEDPRKENECNDQEKEDNVNSTNNVNTVSLTINVAGTIEDNKFPFDPNMPALEDVSIFNFLSDNKMMIYQMKKRAIGTKWVFRNKKDESRIVIRNQARLVSQEYAQEEGFNYDEVFFPVATIKAIRIFLAYDSFKDFLVYQMDVKSTFLYGKIEEEVYVCQPPGFEDPDFLDRVYKVEKALYGLYQAPRAWYETLSTYLLDNGFQRGKIDKTLFIKRHKGLQVKQKNDGTFISQDKYVAEILKKFRFREVNTASTPMETQKPLLKDEDGKEVNVYMYRLMIGSLVYLTSSRPDIMFAVCACARYQFNLKVSHLYVVKRIFRYLKGQPKLGLWYLKDSLFDLVAYTNSDYARASLDKKSTTGGEGSSMPTNPHHTPTILKPSSSQPQKTQKPRKPKRKDTQVPQPSGPTDNVTDEAVHKELGDKLVRVATTVSSIEAEQLNGNITKIQSNATPNEFSSQGTNSGGGPRCQETMGVILLKLGLGKDASKQGMRIDAINVNDEITLVNDADNEMFNVDDLGGEEVFVAKQIVSTVATTETITTEGITLAQTLEALKTLKPKNMEGFKLKDLKLKEFDSIKEMFDRAFRRVNTFEDFRTLLVKGKEKKADEEEVAIDAIPLAVKSQRIVDWKIHKEGKKSYYQITRADGKSQMYMIFSQMLKSFNWEDLEDLYKLVKARYRSTRPLENMDYLLWRNIKTPHVEDEI